MSTGAGVAIIGVIAAGAIIGGIITTNTVVRHKAKWLGLSESFFVQY
jgi:hypothetical protein